MIILLDGLTFDDFLLLSEWLGGYEDLWRGHAFVLARDAGLVALLGL